LADRRNSENNLEKEYKTAYNKLIKKGAEHSVAAELLRVMAKIIMFYRRGGTFDIEEFRSWKLEASASSGHAGAMGETIGHATGHITGREACRLSL
jgi:hypothetical protein